MFVNSLFICTGLQEPTLPQAFKLLLPLSFEWMNIGVMLNLPGHTLRRIGIEQHDTRSRLREVLSEWLKQIDPLPTWFALAEAVALFNKEIADKIKSRINCESLADKELNTSHSQGKICEYSAGINTDGGAPWDLPLKFPQLTLNRLSDINMELTKTIGQGRG